MLAMTTKPVAKGDAIDFNLETMTVEQGLHLIEQERVQPLLTYLRGDTGPKVVKQKEGIDKSSADRLLWQSQARGSYKNDFESSLLSATQE